MIARMTLSFNLQDPQTEETLRDIDLTLSLNRADKVSMTYLLSSFSDVCGKTADMVYDTNLDLSK